MTMALFPAFAGVAEAPDSGRKGESPGGIKKALGGLGGESLWLALAACLGFVYPLVSQSSPRRCRAFWEAGLSAGFWAGVLATRGERGGRGRGQGASVQPCLNSRGTVTSPMKRKRWCFHGETPDASAGCASSQLAFFPVLLISESLTGCLSFGRTRARKLGSEAQSNVVGTAAGNKHWHLFTEG